MEKELKQAKSNIIKIVSFKPESAAKTILSAQLEGSYHAVCVPRDAREYLLKKWNNGRETCDNSDLSPNAIGQIKSESTKKTGKLFCGTDLLETKVSSEEYYGVFANTNLEKAAVHNTYDLYLLTYTDTPWEEDSLRNLLSILLKVGRENRFSTKVKRIDKKLKTKPNLQNFSDNSSYFHFLHPQNIQK